MHEFVVTKELVDAALEACRTNEAKRLRRVIVQVGTYTSFREEPIQYYFNLMKKDIAELANAELVVNMVAGADAILKEIEVD